MRVPSLRFLSKSLRRHGSKSERPVDTIVQPKQPAAAEVAKTQFPTDLEHHKVSQLLVAEGFTQEQADSLILLISQAVGESMKNMMQSLALKNDQQLVIQHNQAEFDKLQSDINDLGNQLFLQKAKKILQF